MRRLGYVYVGTSDNEYSGPLDAPRATRAEVLELLAMVQDCFPEAGLTVDDVLATWAGIRPLIAEEGKTTRDTSREDEVWRGPVGLVTIAGGKLTTYRRMAGRVIDELRDELGPPPNDVDRTEQVTEISGWWEILVFVGDPDLFDALARGKLSYHRPNQVFGGRRAGRHADGALEVVG